MCLGAVTSALCCAGSCFCNCCCKALSACGVPAKNFPKVAYVISDLILMIISVLLMYTIRPLFKENSNLIDCNGEDLIGNIACLGGKTAIKASTSWF